MGIFYKVKSSVVSWFSDIRFYAGGIILFGDSHYKVRGVHVREVLNIIHSGDVLLRKYNHYLGSMLIPGYWSHCAVYVGENKVIHMLGDGITIEDILTFTRCDDIAILRSDDKDLIENAVIKAYEYLDIGVEYDYDFDTATPKRFYCTEFVDNIFSYPIRKKIGKDKIILPDNFTDSIFNVVYSGVMEKR